jgi:transposase InsO family protein
MRSKSEAAESFATFMNTVERSTGRRIITVRSDRGRGEFGNPLLGKTDFMELLSRHGITHQFSSTDTPEQNGRVERRNRVLGEAVRTMLIASKLPQHLWGEAIVAFTHIYNRSPNAALPGSITPYQAELSN